MTADVPGPAGRGPLTASRDVPPDQGHPLAGAREWAGLAVLPVLPVSMDMTVLHLAVPEITRELRPSGTQMLWIVDIYAFMVAGLLITMGAVGDRIGRRRLLLIGGTAFAASLAAAFATGPGMLIAARAALGIAVATLAPSTLALIRTIFADPKQRATATKRRWPVGLGLRRRATSGVYLHGPVGRGRTWLVDVLLQQLPGDGVLRLHAYEAARELHRGFTRQSGAPGATDRAVDTLLDGVRLLFLDELHAHDPGDAMLLSRPGAGAARRRCGAGGHLQLSAARAVARSAPPRAGPAAGGRAGGAL